MEKFKKTELCEYKNIQFEVELEYYYDDIIDEYYVDIELGNENLRKIRNEYRTINKLLLDNEIKDIRNKYKLSQRDFAIVLGFGEVTITRYESKSVQDKAQDKIIRESKNPEKFLEYLRKNKKKFIQLNGQSKYEDLYQYAVSLYKDVNNMINQFDEKDRGNTEFKMSKLKAVIGYIKSKREELTKTTLAKLLWYIDCLSYKIKKKSMTGLVYISNTYGAYPKMYDEILNDKDIETKWSWKGDYECCFIEKVISEESLTDEETHIINFIIDIFKNFKAKRLVDYMHQEKAFIETKKLDVISYHYADDIKIYDTYK